MSPGPIAITPSSPSLELDFDPRADDPEERDDFDPREEAKQDGEKEKLLERLALVERERDQMKKKIESMLKQMQSSGGSPEKGSVTEYTPSPASSPSPFPPLATIFEQFNILVSEKLVSTTELLAQILAANAPPAKNKKPVGKSKKHIRKAGVLLNRAMQDSWERVNTHIKVLGQKALNAASREVKISATNTEQEKLLFKVFTKFLSWVSPEVYSFPSSLVGDVYVGLGKPAGSAADVEKRVKEFIGAIVQIWWWLLLTPESSVKPLWQEEVSSEYFIFVSDTSIKDGAIRFPALIALDGEVCMKGEARPPRKPGQVKKR
eukprot:TRINITY_DN6299_c0_g1_i18.p1 TRINITY_DN6299_c0_g1~~TRINITY_DN6299_c0_g1_i18.p1  ORF type:complete len:320 (+),score=49.25 TRINITY_DN6299_c0_g1_i18:328-1287(+)